MLGADSAYPTIAGYAVLVRVAASGSVEPPLAPEYFEAFVADAIQAELAAYRALPEIRPEILAPWFTREASAWRQITHVLTRHSERRWVISSEGNPSTCRLISEKVAAMGADEVTVLTQEYVYLRWWSLPEAAYAYPYRETNRQRYILVRTPEGWRIEANLRPPPRTVAPNRRAKVTERRSP